MIRAIMIRAAPGLVVAALLAAGCGSAGPGTTAPHLDPAVELAAMDRAMVQIVRGTSHLAEADYQRRVKPTLPIRLRAAGFTAEQAERILARVDAAREDRARMRRWWASLWDRGTRHARR